MGVASGAYRGQERCIQGFSGGYQGRKSLGRHRQRWEDNIKMNLQEVGRGHGLN
jgi:hypothetical protein